MCYIIIRIDTNMFAKFPRSWTPDLKTATKFKSKDTASNYIKNNLRGEHQDIDCSNFKILDALSASMQYEHDQQSAIETMTEIVDVVNQIDNNRGKYLSLYTYYSRELQQADLETSDLLHYIEFSHENVVGGYLAYKKLRDVQQRRRGIKDNLAAVKLIMSCGIFDSATNAANAISKHNEYVKSRTYHPRVLSDLFHNPVFDDTATCNVKEE